MIYVLDTHALIWHLSSDSRLGGDASAALVDPTARIVIPAMALIEIAYLALRGRVPVSLDDVLQFISLDPRCSIKAVDEIVAAKLPAGLNVHDAVICATTLAVSESEAEPVRLLSRDREIIASGVVSTIW